MLKGKRPTKKASLTSRSIAKKIAEFADDKIAQDIVILDMRKIVNFCDFFVICSGNTDRQVKAIANGIEEGLEKLGLEVKHKQGLRKGVWVVFDFGDTVVHIFQKDARAFYQLDYLWQEAEVIAWQKSDKTA